MVFKSWKAREIQRDLPSSMAQLYDLTVMAFNADHRCNSCRGEFLDFFINKKNPELGMLFLDQILNEKAIGIYRQKIVVLCKVRRFISA